MFEAFALLGNVNSTVVKRGFMASFVVEVWYERLSGNCSCFGRQNDYLAQVIPQDHSIAVFTWGDYWYGPSRS
jgi:hypothetical protein